MPDSVYAALYRKTLDTEANLLFLKCSNGQWWLPGGAIESDQYTPHQAVHQLVSQLLTFCDWYPGGIGMWRLSSEAGGHAVHLFEGYLAEPAKVKLRDPTSGLSQELAFFDRYQIREHLYTKGDIPWGQAKMAIYCLHDLYKHGRRANGELLKEDLGELRGLFWNRPEARPA